MSARTEDSSTPTEQFFMKLEMLVFFFIFFKSVQKIHVIVTL